MRAPLLASALLLSSATPAFAAAEGGAKSGLLDPHLGLMTWTIIVFVLLLLGLRKFAFGPILEAVRGREQAITDAMAAAERDRAEAAKLIAEQKAAIANHFRSRDAGYQELTATVARSAEALKNRRLLGVQDLAWALINNPAFLFNR